ncbi:hypothetical protein LJC20_01580 [Eubacteriales bacterium OttesenSCG-928-M02]|nr:hypothetical protein [Eubacteriales bacterium OttesenSCG-928-M02]
MARPQRWNIVGVAVIFCCLFFFGGTGPTAKAGEKINYYALSIGLSDYPGMAYDLGEAPYNDAKRMQQLFSARCPAEAFRENHLLLDGTKEEIWDAMEKAFGKSRPTDINYLYIAGYGENTYDSNNPSLLVQGDDGEDLADITPQELYGMLKKYDGTFVLMLDMNYAGGFVPPREAIMGDTRIQWGVEEARGTNNNLADGRYVLLGAALSDERNHYIGAGEERGGAFTHALLSAWGQSPYERTGQLADGNMDGMVSLGELEGYLLRENLLSTAVAYGEKDSAIFPQIAEEALPLLSNGKSENPLLGMGGDRLQVTLTLTKDTRLTYGIYDKRHFGRSIGQEEAALMAYARGDGSIEGTAGTHTYEIAVPSGLSTGHYFLRIRPQDGRIGQHISFVWQGTAPVEKSITLDVRGRYHPQRGEMLPITVGFTTGQEEMSPCTISLFVEDMDGNILCTLAEKDLARYHGVQDFGLVQPGNFCYWDGRGADGTPLPAGAYRIHAIGEYAGGVVEAVEHISLEKRVVAVTFLEYEKQPVKNARITLDGVLLGVTNQAGDIRMALLDGRYEISVEWAGMTRRGILTVTGDATFSTSLYDGTLALSSLSCIHAPVEGETGWVQLLDAFHPENTMYTAYAGQGVAFVSIDGAVADERIAIKGTGIYPLEYGLNTFFIMIADEMGNERVYTIYIIREYPQADWEYVAPWGEMELVEEMLILRPEGSLSTLRLLSQDRECLFLLLPEAIEIPGYFGVPVTLSTEEGVVKGYALAIGGKLTPQWITYLRGTEGWQLMERGNGVVEMPGGVGNHTSLFWAQGNRGKWTDQDLLYREMPADGVVVLGDNLGGERWAKLHIVEEGILDYFRLEWEETGATLLLYLKGKNSIYGTLEWEDGGKWRAISQESYRPGENRISLPAEVWERMREGGTGVRVSFPEGEMRYGKRISLPN